MMEPNEIRPKGLEEERRDEIAREALKTGFEDPYWLCNLFGHCNTSDLRAIAQNLREDADAIETALDKIESRELTPAEGALYIAERANFGDYEIFESDYDGLPITVDIEDGD